LNELERAILKYLESRDDGWKWVLGTKVYDKEATIELFKKDKRFRKFVIEQAVLLAIDLFSKGSKSSERSEKEEKGGEE